MPAAQTLTVSRQAVDAEVAKARQPVAQRQAHGLVGDLDDQQHARAAALRAGPDLAFPPEQMRAVGGGLCRPRTLRASGVPVTCCLRLLGSLTPDARVQGARRRS